MTFERLNYWITQIDMFNNNMSVFEEPKVLLGNVPTSGQRVVEMQLVLVSILVITVFLHCVCVCV